MKNAPIYPLLFEPIYKEKIWGGRRLEDLGRSLPGAPDLTIGESWELVDLGQTDVSGGGGQEERSIVANGPLAGHTLHQMMTLFGKQLLGNLKPNEFGEFPLMVKFLDADENLSLQVHPSRAYAQTHAEAFLKSESWYIVDATPNSFIYKGVQEGVTPDQFRRALEQHDLEPLLVKIPARPGDCHYLPSGTCHALGAGVLVAEVQTPSDTTFRVFDWGRSGRQLHVKQALECIEFGPPKVDRFEKRTRIKGDQTISTRLIRCEYFHIDHIEAASGFEQKLNPHQPMIWVVLEGGGCISIHGHHGRDEIEFKRGQTMLIPPALSGGHLDLNHETTWLQITLPQAIPTRMA